MHDAQLLVGHVAAMWRDDTEGRRVIFDQFDDRGRLVKAMIVVGVLGIGEVAIARFGDEKLVLGAAAVGMELAIGFEENKPQGDAKAIRTYEDASRAAIFAAFEVATDPPRERWVLTEFGDPERAQDALYLLVVAVVAKLATTWEVSFEEAAQRFALAFVVSPS